jgi:DNA polymerase III subunit gamma/tau
VIPTILSRCQIYDFQRITVKDMVVHLQKIVDEKGISAEPEALHVIAQKADGAMRDALSIFDQVVAFTDGKLTYQAVADNLNVLGHDLYFEMTDMILNEDIPGVLVKLDGVVRKGFDLHHFVSGMGEHFRNLLVAFHPQTIDILELSDGVKEQFKDQAKRVELSIIQNGLNELNEADINYKNSRNPRLLVELSLMKLCSLPARIREKKKTQLA